MKKNLGTFKFLMLYTWRTTAPNEGVLSDPSTQ
jgi:hypothetical protein